ncbi:hypothetical protein AMS68_004135 [Peltaster fructicola]|uniref:Cystathionine gamma-synthase n=1 Tax=Peltaster fructicola TaxID=286661 RepID=A0A6H0XVI4_9PEZI|nr:hypothetical protein AMS68_004135 [Peltaster fructicola]
MADPNDNPNLPDEALKGAALSEYSLATLSVHADDAMNTYSDVAPALHVSTTFRYPSDPSKLVPIPDEAPRWIPGGAVLGDSHVYSRCTAPNLSRLEMILSSALGAPCLTYSSGLASFHALLTYLNPKVVAIGAGYHGCHGTLKIFQKLTGCKIVDLFDEKSWSGDDWSLGKGDVVHLETPVNPSGKAYNIQHFADLAHAKGAVLTVDATFGPPPLQDPFKHGADYVMHSGTKYIGGHSDMLCGVIAISNQLPEWEKHYWGMFSERIVLGSILGNLEGWLGIRSLRTLELRVKRQSSSTERLVSFIHNAISGRDLSEAAVATKAVIVGIEHASLQEADMAWLKRQMPGGFGPVFTMNAKSADLAKQLPSKLELFHHATSLGGVESLIEWRKMSDPTVADTVLRVSVGVEAWEDLRDDIVAACKAIAK